MSRRTLERRRIANERWPVLLRLLGDDASLRPKQMVATLSLDDVGVALEEWRDWNADCSWKADRFRYFDEVFDLGEDDQKARNFMDQIYDEAISRWSAAGREFSL